MEEPEFKLEANLVLFPAHQIFLALKVCVSSLKAEVLLKFSPSPVFGLP